jgi:hypothetical protein
MPKTNYTKVEEFLGQGLRKMMVEDLLNKTKNVNKPLNPEIQYAPEIPKNNALIKAQQHLISALKRDLTRLQKKDQEVFTKLKIKKKQFKMMIEHPENLRPEDWETLKQIKIQVDQYKAELLKQIPQATDENLVDIERNKHINKRFNVNEKWLPLY